MADLSQDLTDDGTYNMGKVYQTRKIRRTKADDGETALRPDLTGSDRDPPAKRQQTTAPELPTSAEDALDKLVNGYRQKAADWAVKERALREELAESEAKHKAKMEGMIQDWAERLDQVIEENEGTIQDRQRVIVQLREELTTIEGQHKKTIQDRERVIAELQAMMGQLVAKIRFNCVGQFLQALLPLS